MRAFPGDFDAESVIKARLVVWALIHHLGDKRKASSAVLDSD